MTDRLVKGNKYRFNIDTQLPITMNPLKIKKHKKYLKKLGGKID